MMKLAGKFPLISKVVKYFHISDLGINLLH